MDDLSKKIINTNIDLNNPNEEFDSWSTEIDTIINSRNIGSIDLIKIPVEEYQNILLSSRKLFYLKQKKINLFIEFPAEYFLRQC